jgi:hypothetical protein
MASGLDQTECKLASSRTPLAVAGPPPRINPACARDETRTTVRDRHDQRDLREPHAGGLRRDDDNSSAVRHHSIGIRLGELFRAHLVANPLQREQSRATSRIACPGVSLAMEQTPVRRRGSGLEFEIA